MNNKKKFKDTAVGKFLMKKLPDTQRAYRGLQGRGRGQRFR